jgi:hypothetical protein
MAAPRHVAQSRVAWVDTDAAGRIHFTAAFRWAEMAETALLRSLGLLDDWAAVHVGGNGRPAPLSREARRAFGGA